MVPAILWLQAGIDDIIRRAHFCDSGRGITTANRNACGQLRRYKIGERKTGHELCAEFACAVCLTVFIKSIAEIVEAYRCFPDPFFMQPYTQAGKVEMLLRL